MGADAFVHHGPGRRSDRGQAIGLARQTQQAMERGARSAVRELRSRGVVRAISFLGYYLRPVVWLVTEHDAERDSYWLTTACKIGYCFI